MGKNYSGNTGRVNNTRKESDFYPTHYSLTEQFMKTIWFPRYKDACILEPACGDGAITKVLFKHGYSNVRSYDKDVDFLKETERFGHIITNPPYSLAKEFILKAKEVATKSISFLLPLSYLHGVDRYRNIWLDEKFPLANVSVFTRYPMLGTELREDGKYTTGMQVYAWYTWDYDWNTEPIISWIDNNEYILSKKDK